MSSTLIKDSFHSYPLLGLYCATAGVLADAWLVEFQIFDCSASFPGTQKYPSSGRANVTTGTGHLGAGRYGAFDSTTNKAWKPTAAYSRCRIVWFYKATSTSDEQVVERWFEVVTDAVATQPSSGLALIQDVKDTGVTLGTLTDRRIHELLILWRDLIERYCRQPFRPLYQSMKLRGGGGRALMLPYAFAGMASITRAGRTDAEDSSLYDFFGNEGDDRHNPRIEVAAETGDLFTRREGGTIFTGGVAYTLLGAFGFVEPESLGAPLAVRDAIVQLVVSAVTDIVSGGGGSGSSTAGPITSETTDGHNIKYSEAGLSSSSVRGGFLGLLGDAAIRDALDLYRAPIAIDTPTVTMVEYA